MPQTLWPVASRRAARGWDYPIVESRPRDWGCSLTVWARSLCVTRCRLIRSMSSSQGERSTGSANI